VGDARGQATQQGEVGCPLCFPFQTLALSHLVTQSGSALLDPSFEFSVRLPKRHFALLQEDSRVVQGGTDLLHFLHRTRGNDVLLAIVEAPRPSRRKPMRCEGPPQGFGPADQAQYSMHLAIAEDRDIEGDNRPMRDCINKQIRIAWSAKS